MKNPTLKEPTIPYVDTHIVGEHNGLNNGNITII
jgi:serine/threonine-protein phosphatase 2A regulatory subunit B'